jgi:3-hydroxybutyryl-CoA dehydrogenase
MTTAGVTKADERIEHRVIRREIIATAGAGRMGRGIAVAFAYAGHQVKVVDLKPRTAAGAGRLAADICAEVRSTLSSLANLDLFDPALVETIAGQIEFVPFEHATRALAIADVVFEAVPETMAAKRHALQVNGTAARPDTVVASTTSTILTNELQALVVAPERYMNAHWLNPAFLVPLVELAPGRDSDPGAVDRLKTLLLSIGKVPVICRASPGYIVPRIQALAMNEAARLVEEGVATAQEVDKATRYGFGFRFAVLGLLEFIDWGGSDTLYHASRYLTGATGEARFATLAIVEATMASGRAGLARRCGFHDYGSVDMHAYRQARMRAFVAQLRHMDLARLPVLPGASPDE